MLHAIAVSLRFAIQPCRTRWSFIFKNSAYLCSAEVSRCKAMWLKICSRGCNWLQDSPSNTTHSSATGHRLTASGSLLDWSRTCNCSSSHALWRRPPPPPPSPPLCCSSVSACHPFKDLNDREWVVCRQTSFWPSMKSMAQTMIKRLPGTPSLLKTQVRSATCPT